MFSYSCYGFSHQSKTLAVQRMDTTVSSHLNRCAAKLTHQLTEEFHAHDIGKGKPASIIASATWGHSE
jgi:hypothetical protein